MTDAALLPPRDIALLVIFGLMAITVMIRPWLGVLALAFLNFFHPQGYAQGVVQQLPLVAAMFGITLAAAAKAYAFDGYRPAWQALANWRLLMMFALFAWFVVTTYFSMNPWAAWPYLREVLKILPAIALMVLLIDSTEKLKALLFVIALSIALVTLKGGYWAVMTGFSDRVYGPPGSQYTDNNEFAVAMVMSLPLLFVLLTVSQAKLAKCAALALIGLTYVAVISSWSRGGLLALATVTALLAVNRWRNVPVLLGVALALVAVFSVLPDAWFVRMGTIFHHEAEGSAQSRLDVWRVGLDFVQRHPWVGGGFRGWLYATLSLGGSMAWHSAYIQILTEHGWPGFALWFALLGGTILAGLAAPFIRSPASSRASSELQSALSLSLAGFAIGAAFLSIAYWEISYWCIAASAVTAHLSTKGMRPLSSPRGALTREP